MCIELKCHPERLKLNNIYFEWLSMRVGFICGRKLRWFGLLGLHKPEPSVARCYSSGVLHHYKSIIPKLYHKFADESYLKLKDTVYRLLKKNTYTFYGHVISNCRCEYLSWFGKYGNKIVSLLVIPICFCFAITLHLHVKPTGLYWLNLSNSPSCIFSDHLIDPVEKGLQLVSLLDLLDFSFVKWIRLPSIYFNIA